MIKFNAQKNSFIHNDAEADGVEVSNEYFNELIKSQSSGFEIKPDGSGYPVSVNPLTSLLDNGSWVYSSILEQGQVNKIKPSILNDLKNHYLKLKSGAFAVDFTDIVKKLNTPTKTDILFPTTQPPGNLSVAPKVDCQNQNIVNFSTNKIQYPTHDRCVIWVQDSLDIQSLVSLGHVLAAEWSSKNNGSSIFDYVHYQKVGIAGVQYNATQIRTAQPDGYPIVLDKHSLKMWCFIFNKINEKKEQLHGRYFLLKTQIQNCTTMDELESVRQRINTGWVEVFSDTQTPAGLTVIS
jgi:hypothetical protein